MLKLKRFSYGVVGIIVGLSLASAAYHIVSLIGVVVSSAETVGDLHASWFPIRVLVALGVAKVCGGWVYGLLLRRS